MNLSIMKNPKVMIMSALAAGALVAGGAIASQKISSKNAEGEGVTPTEHALYHAKDKELRDVRFLKSYGPFVPADVDFEQLDKILKQEEAKTSRDSVEFVNKKDKNMADTLAMVKTFEDRDNTREAVQYLKDRRAQQIAYNKEQEKEQARKDSVARAKLENR